MNHGRLVTPREFVSPDDFLWAEPRTFSRAEAWLDLFFSASPVETSQLVQGRCLILRRGELVASVRYLAKRWSWSKGKVERFLAQIKGTRIGTATRQQQTIVTILNYDDYIELRRKGELKSGTPTRTSAGQRRDSDGDKVNDSNHLDDFDSTPAKPEVAAAAEQFRQAWNATAETCGLPQCREMTPKRKRALSARMKSESWRDSWQGALNKLAQIPFYVGKNERNWRADVDYFLRPDTVTKVLERGEEPTTNNSKSRNSRANELRDAHLRQNAERL